MAAESTAGPTVPRRQLGRHLRALRNQAKLTTKLAAQALEWSEPKLWRIETGQTALRSLDVEAMCRVYGASAEVTQGLMVLARETRAVGWWHPRDDVIPDWLDLYLGLEEAASRLGRYDPELVPGLLQTAAYARAVIRAERPDLGDEALTRRVQARLARQALLVRVTAPLTAELLLGEAVLRRPVGSTQVMAEQLDQLADAAMLPTVSIRVVPLRARLHRGVLSGPFVILRFPVNGDGQETEPPVVYVPGFTGALYLERPGEIRRYQEVYADIAAAALDEHASRTLIRQAAREYAR
ncbi:MAG TPA: helix-turn-helix transcriptional regulator [Streptosporangiaceae bacterium]